MNITKLYLRLLLASIFVMSFQVLPAFSHTSQIEIQKGEKWWGIFISNAPLEPFNKPFRVNTSDSPVNGLYSPIMISNAGRYIWSEHPMSIEFDGNSITINSDVEKVSAIKAGKNLRDAYLVCCHKNFPPNGHIPDVDMFITPQYDLTVEAGFIQDQQSILDYAARIIKEGLPAGILIIPEGWRSHNGYYFDNDRYPDPADMCRQLHEMGFKVMITITPYVPAYGKNYIEGKKNERFLKKRSGEVAVIETNGGFITSMDMSDPQQVVTIGNYIQILKDYGINGFRFDCRDILTILNVKQEADLFMVPWFELGKGHSLCEYIPGGISPLSSYLTSNENFINDESELISVVNDIISAGITGYPYSSVSVMSSDTSVLYSNEQLMAKFLLLEAAMPVMKIRFAPWRIKDPKLYESIREAIKFRADLGGYLRELVTESATTAEPLLRHMEYQFPKSGFADCDDQFMLGPKYLFAPNTGNENKRTVRLPKGVWLDRDGKRHKGPLVTEVDCSDGKIIYFELSSNK